MFISAPYDAGCASAACFPWAAYAPFQPLLGFDAQMAGVAAQAGRDGVPVFGLAAPEIFPNLAAMFRLSGATSASAAPIHLRFGTPRMPRLLKGAVNMAVLAESAPPQPELGMHPFASGTVLPHGTARIVAYDTPLAAPVRVGGGAIPLVTLPVELAEADMLGIARAEAVPPTDVLLQTAADFAPADWARRPGDGRARPVPALTARAIDESGVLVPWNLAHPGSVVPDLLAKVQMLAAQGRFRPILLVVPYNDVPVGLPALAREAAACRQRQTKARVPALLFARGRTLAAGMHLAGVCRRAWIDGTDPEWAWTAGRLRRLGLRLNLIAAEAVGAPAYDLAPDELLVTQVPSPYGPLAFRGRILSVRRLEALAAAAGTEPAWTPPVPAAAKRTKLADILLQGGALANG